MAKSPLESQQTAIMRIKTNIEAVEPLFPDMWDTMEKIPEPTWPDRLGLVDQPGCAWERIHEQDLPLRLRLLATPVDFTDMYDGQMYYSDPNETEGPQVEISNSASGVASIQSLFPHLWDKINENARYEDTRRPISPLSAITEESIGGEEYQDFGPIAAPVYADEYEGDWSDAGSEYDDYYYDSDNYYDSGIDTGDETDTDTEDYEFDPFADLEQPVAEYWCGSCDKLYFLPVYPDEND